MAVTTVFASTASADLRSTNATYSTAANGSSLATPVASANELWVGQFNFSGFSCYESFVDFDLAGLAPNQVVSSAVMSLWLVTDQSTVNFYNIALLYDWTPSGVTTADWRTPAQMVALGAWWTHIHTSGIGATGAYKAWADTSDMRALCQLFAGSNLYLCLASELHRAAISPPSAEYLTWSSADVGGTTQDPKLVITHSFVAAEVTGEGGVVLGGEATIETVPLANFSMVGGVELGGEATVEFVHGGGAVASDIVVEWQFDGQTWTAITDRVMSLQTFSGRDGPSTLAAASPGKLSMLARNNDDAFSYYNAASPFNIAPHSLRTGRMIRVRTAESVPADPVLLARDRFNRAASTDLGQAETGQTWANRQGGWDVVGRVAQSKDITNPTFDISTIDVGTDDLYIQGRIRQLTGARHIGLVARYVDPDNYVYCFISANPAQGTFIAQRIAGVSTSLGSVVPFTGYEGMTIGMELQGTAATLYIDGVPLVSGTTTGPTSNDAGLYTIHSAFTGRLPEVADFGVWDRVAAETEGILWTGTVKDVEVSVQAGPEKTATIMGQGVLSKMTNDVAAPRLPKAGLPTGMLVGDIAARVGMLHPPFPLDAGALTTGAVGIDDGKALDLARQFERVERGFVHETNEGRIGFADSARRAGATAAALFSDQPGAQFGYSEFEPIDRNAGIANRVTAGVASSPPVVVSATNRTGGNTTAVNVLMPTTTAGQLLVVFIASSVDDGHDWNVPIWWTSHRDVKAANGMRVYSRFCDGTEGGTTVSFFSNTGSSPGLWTANIYVIDNWFKSTHGLAMSVPAPGDDPNAVFHGWGRHPTLFIVSRAGIGATGATSWTTNVDPPDGYASTFGNSVSSGSVAFDAAIISCFKVDVTEIENPTAFDVITGFDLIDETAVFAIRGYNGEHTKATLDNPETKGGDGVFVTVDDLDSQDEHGLLTWEAPSLFADEADAEAYGDDIIAAHSDDVPTVRISYWASKSAHYRNQAIRRRVGDMVSLDSSHNAGYGVAGQFFIESVAHTWSNGTRLWRVDYEVSPD